MLPKILKDFTQAIKNLEEVLDVKKDDITRDSAIKRFELCFDLAWKAIKSYAKKQGLECNSPRECIKTAFQLKLIGYNESWLKIIDDRNLTAHLYSEKNADEVYPRLSGYLVLFKALAEKLKN